MGTPDTPTATDHIERLCGAVEALGRFATHLPSCELADPERRPAHCTCGFVPTFLAAGQALRQARP